MVRLSQLCGSWHATFSLLALLHTLSVEEVPVETFKDLLEYIYEEDMVGQEAVSLDGERAYPGGGELYDSGIVRSGGQAAGVDGRLDHEKL